MLGQLFAKPEQLKAAAKYVNEHYLSKPYTGELDAFRAYNQRAIILLEDGTILDITGDVAEKYLTPATGVIDVEAIEKDYGKKVVKMLHRPNHDIRQAMRTAAAISSVCQFYAKCTAESGYDLNADQIARLQLMKLFSVAGRQDETGFGESGTEHRYQTFRALSAMAFLEYCQENEIYGEDKLSLYMDALTVELMGYPTPPLLVYNTDPAKCHPKPFPTIAKFMIDEGLPLPNPSTAETKTKKQLQKEKEYAQFLKVMDKAHGIDLMRCDSYMSDDPDPRDKEHVFAKRFLAMIQPPSIKDEKTYLDYFVSKQFKDPKFYENALGYVLLQARMLKKTGDKTTTTMETDEAKIKEIILNFIANLSKNTDIALKPVNEGVFEELYYYALQDKFFLDNVNLSFLTVPDDIIPMIEKNKKAKAKGEPLPYPDINPVDRYRFELQTDEQMHQFMLYYLPYFLADALEKELFDNGEYQYAKEAFDFVQYHKEGDLSSRDTDKEVELLFQELDLIPKPPYFGMTVPEHKLTKSPLETVPAAVEAEYLKEGVKIYFSSSRDAEKAMKVFHQLGLIKKIPSIDPTDKGHIVSVQLSKQEFAKLSGKLKYRLAVVPKKHSVESTLVDEKGNLSALSLISRGDGLTRVLNSVDTHDSGVPDYDYKMKFLEKPVHRREPKLFWQQQGYPIYTMKMVHDELTHETQLMRDLADNVPLIIQDAAGKIWLYSVRYFNNIKTYKLRHLEDFPYTFGDLSEDPTPLETKDKSLYDLINKYHDHPLPEQHRKIYTNPRTADVVKRDFTPKNTNPAFQVPILKNPAPTDESMLSGTFHRERHLETNTIFAKKDSHALLPKSGIMQSFTGFGGDEKRWLPIGFLSDLGEVHLKGERYIWTTNVRTNTRFWLGSEAIKEDPGTHKQAVSVEELKATLDESEKKGTATDWNELLVGPSKVAIKALFVPSIESIDKEHAFEQMLIFRLNTLNHALRLKEKFGYDVPILIIDGFHEPQYYSEKLIRADLKQAAALLQQDKFPYSEAHDLDIQIDLLKDLFDKVARIKELDKIPQQDADLDSMLKRMDMVGGEHREMKLYQKKKEQHASAASQLLKVQKETLLRAVVLGHAKLVEKIIADGFDVTKVLHKESGKKAVDFANEHRHGDIVALLQKEAKKKSAKKATGAKISQVLTEKGKREQLILSQGKDSHKVQKKTAAAPDATAVTKISPTK